MAAAVKGRYTGAMSEPSDAPIHGEADTHGAVPSDSAAYMRNEDLRASVAAWLKKNGYPLEAQVARSFLDAGFDVGQSEYFQDVESGTWREIDVVARGFSYQQLDETTPGALPAPYYGLETHLTLAIECKSGSAKPWLFVGVLKEFVLGYGSAGLYTRDPLSNRVLRHLLQTRRRAPLFRPNVPIAAGITTANVDTRKGGSLNEDTHGGKSNKSNQPDRNAPDPAYDAVLSAVKAAEYDIRRRPLPNESDDPSVMITTPVVITAAPLFHFAPTPEDPYSVKPVRRVTLWWRNPQTSGRATFVHVVHTSEALAYANEAKQALAVLGELPDDFVRRQLRAAMEDLNRSRPPAQNRDTV